MTKYERARVLGTRALQIALVFLGIFFIHIAESQDVTDQSGISVAETIHIRTVPSFITVEEWTLNISTFFIYNYSEVLCHKFMLL